MLPRRARECPHGRPAVISTLVERLERRLLMAARDAGPALGTGGVATFAVPGTGTAGYNVLDAALQRDGKVVVLLSDVKTGRPTLARVTAAGALDTTFSGDGLATDVAAANVAQAVGVQS